MLESTSLHCQFKILYMKQQIFIMFFDCFMIFNWNQQVPIFIIYLHTLGYIRTRCVDLKTCKSISLEEVEIEGSKSLLKDNSSYFVCKYVFSLPNWIPKFEGFLNYGFNIENKIKIKIKGY